MSEDLLPTNPAQSPSGGQPGEVRPAVPAASHPAWYDRISSVIFVIFCFEMGLFLVVYPWIDQWSENYVSMLAPGPYLSLWRHIWNSAYFRGGVSGVGLINIWVAVHEVFQMFSRREK